MVNFDWNTVALIILAAIQCYTAYLTRRTEKNTNSMKDALVATTARDSLAKGTAAGLAEGHAAGLEQGRQEGRARVDRLGEGNATTGKIPL